MNDQKVSLVNADLKTRPQYRLGDSVLLRDYAAGHRAIHRVMSNAEMFRHSILYEFGNRAELLDPDPQWAILKEVTDAYTSRHRLPMPGYDELVIHLRMGDLKGYKGTEHAFADFIRKTVEHWQVPINQVTLVSAIHFGESVLVNRFNAKQLNDEADAEARRINAILESLAEFMPSVKLYSNDDIDMDFCYLANASNLVIGNGHFSLCAAMISSARLVVPPWVKSGGLIDPREYLADRKQSLVKSDSTFGANSSAAILCIVRNEHPYLDEWLEYHLKLGFDRIYLVSTDDDFPGVINKLIGHENLRKLELFHYYSFGRNWQGPCYNHFLQFVVEEWVMVLDLDEFLCLPGHDSIHAFIEHLDDSVGQVQFPWLMQVCNRYAPDRVTDIISNESFHASDHVKSMVRRSSVSMLGVHKHRCSGNSILSSGEPIEGSPRHERFLQNTDYTLGNAFILHLSSRGYLDTLIRILGHRFANEKNDQREFHRVGRFLTEAADWENIPNRFLLGKLYEMLPLVEPPGMILPELESVIDNHRLRLIFNDHIRGVVDFSISSPDDLAIEFEARFGLKRKIDHLDISDAFSLEDYLQCGTQLEYIRKLRRFLVAGSP